MSPYQRDKLDAAVQGLDDYISELMARTNDQYRLIFDLAHDLELLRNRVAILEDV